MNANNKSELVAVTEEELQVHKHMVATGKVRVRTVVDTVEHPVRETLVTERVEVRRVPVGREIQHVPEIRSEGDITVIPVVEEVVVVEKRLVLKEELHVRKLVTTEQVEIPLTLRKEKAMIEREEAEHKR